MHNGMTLTRNQGQGHRDTKVAKSTKLRQAVSHRKMRHKIVFFSTQSEISGANLCESIFNQNKHKIKRILADVCR